MYVIDLTNNIPNEYYNYNVDNNIYYEYDLEKIEEYSGIIKTINVNKDLLIISIFYISIYLFVLFYPLIKRIRFNNFNKISLIFSIIKFFLVLKTI
jgi:hypothetical protein